MGFKEYEQRERKFLHWYISSEKCNNCKLEEESPIGSKERNDFVISSGRTIYIMGEIKIRSFEHDKYDTSLLELDKVKGLMDKFEIYHQMGETNKLYYYAVYPTDRTILVYDIINTPSTLSYEWCPVSTAEDWGKKRKIMLNYKIEDAIIKIKY
jgi:hypothetical protein